MLKQEKILFNQGDSLARHTAKSLKHRFEKNVDTENMPNWDLTWKGYHYICSKKGI